MKQLVILTIIAILTLSACTRESVGTNVILNAAQDVDGNIYDAVYIGKQVWLKQNLRTTHFRDGSEIPLDRITYYNYSNESLPCRHEINSDFAGGQLLSDNRMLYNGYAVDDPRGLCPEGWHVPSDAEWNQLLDYVSSHSEWCYNGNPDATAKALTNKQGWNINPIKGSPGCHPSENNATGFSASPSIYPDISQFPYNHSGCFLAWSSTTSFSSYQDYSKSYFEIYENNPQPYFQTMYYSPYNYFRSVRCVKD